MSNLKTDWRGCAARMRGDLDRADLTGRARRLAEFAIKATLMNGRTRVVIPNRMELCKLLKIGKTHVAEVSTALVSARILQIKEMADGWELLVFPDSSGWDVEWTYTREEMTAFLSYVNRAPGQCQGELIEPSPSLARTLAEVSAENSMRPAVSYQNGNHPASPVANRQQNQVPKMGTPDPFKLKGSKTYKPYTFDTFKGALLAIEGNEEGRAMDGCRQILGEAIMLNDGGKWRNRWRMNKAKVHRVFAAVGEDIEAKKVRHPGAHAEYTWKQFAD
jgi:hypothetical protein